jgi:CRP-like cAMP-binding protein
MNTDLILSNIANHISLTQEAEDYFLSLLQPKILKRKESLLREGEICRNIAFISNGFIKSYFINKNGTENILNIVSENQWISDISSLISRHPSNLFIQAIEKSEIFLLSRTDQEKLCIKFPQFERYFRVLIEQAFAKSQQRIVDKTSLTAEEHFLKFSQENKDLIHRLPNKLIAAYIGVTPEFFSTMYNKIVKKG